MAWPPLQLLPQMHIPRPQSKARSQQLIGRPPQKVTEGPVSCCYSNMPLRGLPQDPKQMLSGSHRAITSTPHGEHLAGQYSSL